MTDFTNILNFWFGSPDNPDYGKPKQAWFNKNPEFDLEVRSRFFSVYQQAAKGELNHWQKSPLSCLALIIILDQFSRNLFRNQPQAFATDTQALELAKYAVRQGFDQELLPAQRWFIYLPFEHSENLADQREAVRLFSSLLAHPESADPIKYAKLHLEVIEHFGRFPHRNEILGRQSTPKEIEFLKTPGSSF
jgi:uncharacterized protein (DUF924 family)